MKTLRSALLTTIFFTSISMVSGQDIIKKKKQILVDGTVCFTLERSNSGKNVLLKNAEGETVVKIMNKERIVDGIQDQYQVVYFSREELSFSTTSFSYTAKLLVKNLYKDKALVNCMMDKEALSGFVEKQDEEIE